MDVSKIRRENLKAFEKFFVHILEVAAQSRVLKKVGTGEGQSCAFGNS